MIEIRKVTKFFDKKKVLDNLNLNIAPGETFVIIGRSGCGKSVLLKHMMGILKPDSGEILIDGKNIEKISEKNLNEIRLRFGMLFQSGALFDSLTVGENVAFGLTKHKKLIGDELHRVVKEKLSLVGLESIEDLMPSELSGGMKKRVALARAIAMNPEVILYDEPTTGVDPIMADAINNLILDLHSKLSVTSVAVTHDISSAYKIADRIGMLYQGAIIEIGTPKEIEKTNNPVVHQFVTGSAHGPIAGHT